MAIQFRRGAFADFIKSKMVAGEPAVVQSGDTSTQNGKAFYICYTPGSVDRVLTEQDKTAFDSQISDIEDDLAAAEKAIESVRQSIPAVDATLTTTGAAADAKKTGDEICDLKSDLEDISEEVEGEHHTDYEYIPIPFSIDDRVTTEAGLTRTQNADAKTVHVSGTATQGSSFALRNENGYVSLTLEAGKTYRLRGCPAGGREGSTTRYDLDLRKTVVGTIEYVEFGSGTTFTVSETASYYPHIRVTNGTTIDATFAPVIEELREVLTPVLTAKDIVARGDINIINTEIERIDEELDDISQDAYPNRNLIKFTTGEYVDSVAGVTFSQNAETGQIVVSGNANTNLLFPVKDGEGTCSVSLEKGKYYTLSGSDPDNVGSSNYFLALCRSVGGTIVYSDYGFAYGRTFIADATETLYLHIRIIKNYGDGTVYKPQVEESEFPTEFIPHDKKSGRDDIARHDNIKQSCDIENTVMDGDIINAMLDCAKTYISQGLPYGQRTAIHWYENGTNYTKDHLFDNKENYTPTEIDCSSFALLVLGGIPYEGSKYVGNENYFGMAGYCFDIFHGDEDARPSGGSQTLTHNMAKWFEDNGMGFEPAEDGSDLLPGDILFFSYPDRAEYRGIGHCEIFCHKETNYPVNYKEPTLVTMASDSGSDSARVFARPYSWWNGSDSSGRKLEYVGRIPLQSVKRKVFSVFANPDYASNALLYGYPFHASKYTPITLEFDGVLNTVGDYFEISFDRTIVLETKRIETGMIGAKAHYKCVIPVSGTDLSLVRITSRGTGASSAKITDVRYADGFNF